MDILPKTYAVNIEDIWPLAYKNEPQFQTFAGIFSYFLPRVLLIAGVIFFLLFILAGYSFLNSARSGDPQAKEKWRQILTYGAVGLIIIFGAYWVLQLINFVSGGSFKDIL